MSDKLIFSDKIIKFDGEAESEEQVSRLKVIQLLADKAITIKKRTLSDFLGHNFNIPDYQRGYEWRAEQWTELWSEIKPLTEAKTISTDPEVPDVFFGSVFFSEREQGDEIVLDVIDGQQRITTLTILFKLMSDRVESAIQEDSELIRSLGAEIGNIQSLVYKDPSAGASSSPVLDLDRHNSEFFEALIKGDEYLIIYLANRKKVHGNTKDNAITIQSYLNKTDIDQDNYFDSLNKNETYEEKSDSTIRPNLTDRQKLDLPDDSNQEIPDRLKTQILSNKVEIEETNQLLLDCYEFFRKRLDETLEDLDSAQDRAYALTNMKNFILYSFHTGYFKVDDDHPRLLMKIFEILNDRGVELKITDVIRTRVVGRFRGESTEEEYLDKWESIVGEFGNKHSRVIDFLQTYFVTTGEVDSRGKIKDRILEAFSLTENGSEAVLDAQMTDIDEAKDFIDNLRKYSVYYHHIIDPNNYGVDFGDNADEKIENECNQIITRLHNTNTSIWEPIVLGLYHDTREEVEYQVMLLSILKAAESMAIRSYVAMDINVRDQAYANLMKEYASDDSNEELVDTLTDIETENPQAVGEELVRALYRTKWRAPWGKQVLRKISSEEFDTREDEIVLRQLNIDDGLVHLEHIFPQTPVRSDSANPYEWLNIFFRTDESDKINQLVSKLVNKSEEDDDISEDDGEMNDLLNEISEEYINDLGNQILLRSRENLSIGNSLFGTKLATYFDTEEFCKLRTNEYLCEEFNESDQLESVQTYVSAKSGLSDLGKKSWEKVETRFDDEFESREELKSHLESVIIEHSDSFITVNSRWTYKEVTVMRANIIKALCESIKFSDDEFEFESVGESTEETENETEDDTCIKPFLSLSKEETKRRNDVFATNYSHRV